MDRYLDGWLLERTAGQTEIQPGVVLGGAMPGWYLAGRDVGESGNRSATEETESKGGMMATELWDLVQKIGNDIAKSGMFGVENESQGRILALSCIAKRRDPIAFVSENHLMKGKLTPRADGLLGRISSCGGDYKVIERTPDVAEIEIVYRGRNVRERLTWEEARLEPFVYQGKKDSILAALRAGKADELVLKDTYATRRSRMQMLWARVVSDTVRVVAPELIAGQYTPEEVSDFAGVPLPSITETASTEVPRAVAAEPTTKAAKVEAEVETAREPLITDSQKSQLNALVVALGYESKLPVSLEKRGVSSVDQLTENQAVEFIRNLEGLAEKQKAKAGMQELSTTSRGNLRGPIPKEVYESLLARLKELGQLDKALFLRVTGHIRDSGLRLADLSWEQGEALVRYIDGGEIERFFEMSLIKPEPTLDASASQESPEST